MEIKVKIKNNHFIIIKEYSKVTFHQYEIILLIDNKLFSFLYSLFI